MLRRSTRARVVNYCESPASSTASPEAESSVEPIEKCSSRPRKQPLDLAAAAAAAADAAYAAEPTGQTEETREVEQCTPSKRSRFDGKSSVHFSDSDATIAMFGGADQDLSILFELQEPPPTSDLNLSIDSAAPAAPPPRCYDSCSKLLYHACVPCAHWRRAVILKSSLEKLEQRKRNEEANPSSIVSGRPACFYWCMARFHKKGGMECTKCGDFIDKRTLARALYRLERQRRREEYTEDIVGRPSCYYTCMGKMYREEKGKLCDGCYNWHNIERIDRKRRAEESRWGNVLRLPTAEDSEHEKVALWLKIHDK